MGDASYADMTEEHAEKLRKRKVSILTIIFGLRRAPGLRSRGCYGGVGQSSRDGDEECEALGAFGPVMKLEDVVEACGSR